MIEEQDAFASNPPPPSFNNPPSTPPPSTRPAQAAQAAPASVLRTVRFQGQGLTFETQWGVGIGGDIWTTGSLLCRFLEQRHVFFQRVFHGARILCVVFMVLWFGGSGERVRVCWGGNTKTQVGCVCVWV
jgi:hypothetical protein